ncbi:MAG: hypothetical protein ACRDD7_11560 [Peptostreptococcaceae bacterium]
MSKVKTSIFKQKVLPLTYKYNGSYEIYETTDSGFGYSEPDPIDVREIYTCSIEMPLLNRGNKFYIEELDKYVVINQAIRTSGDNVLYIINETISEWKSEEHRLERLDYVNGKIAADKLYREECKKERLSKENKERYVEKNWLYKMFNKYDENKVY